MYLPNYSKNENYRFIRMTLRNDTIKIAEYKYLSKINQNNI